MGSEELSADGSPAEKIDMSAVWRVDFDPAHLYFVTSAAIQHSHLFKRDVMKQVIVDSWNYTQSEGWLTFYAYVIMPNHIHCIVRCQPDHPVMDVVRDFKKFTSKRIIGQYQAEGNERVLSFLQEAVRRPRKQTYAVWEDEYMARDIVSTRFLLQKMEYVHNNPIQPHWRLVDRAEDYEWSSARFYTCGEPVVVPVSDARELIV